ncbi:hypothetical protein NHX12_019762 [Muraenolepis orangiensis]|uniref:P-type ATPase N-terminal domain-containing protein n=1 Tax=Muraenolepis orangiensis TaxID=630683 RepID=A0A9Q0EU56_9TELE|nr:hypothetical protein NHX12_019762 [Muraenolepis orangiensis]
MECFHWLRHRCQRLVASDGARGWYSPPDGLPAKRRREAGGRRRTVLARRGPYQTEYQAVSKEYRGNAIRTTKYSLLSFLPVNLFQQFRRVANLYFLFLVLLNWVPAVEAFQKEITMVPLLVVLMVIAFKDALEDYRRYLFDKKVNYNSVHIYSSQKHVGRKSRTVVSSSGSAGDEELLRILQLYSDNKIRTTKYSLLSFLPKNLLEQLHRFANIYFLFLAALNFVPVVEAFQPEVAVIPVVLVMSVTAIKDIWEDYRRSKLDRFMNKLYCQVYRSKQKAYMDQHWQDVRVGDFIRLSCNEIIPADVVLLYSSDPRGICYIETANLDGETNLKQRQVVADLPLQVRCSGG